MTDLTRAWAGKGIPKRSAKSRICMLYRGAVENLRRHHCRVGASRKEVEERGSGRITAAGAFASAAVVFIGHRSIESRTWFIEVEALPVPKSGAFVDRR